MARRKSEDRRTTYRFTGLLLENWRNFVNADVDLQRRVFLVGPNASGKSNFLDVFRFLYDIAAVGGGFQEAVRKRRGVSGLRSLAARRYPDIGVRVTVGNDEEEARWEYRIRFAQDNIRRPFIKEETILHSGHTLLERPNADDERDPERKRQTYLEQVNVNREFRELVDFLGSVRYRHIVPQLVRDPDRWVGRQNDPFGGDFLEQLARTQSRTLNSRLRRITRALQVAVPQLQNLELERDDRGTPHLRGRYEHWRQHGAWQSEQDLSDGTLRVLGFLWSILDGSGPLLLERARVVAPPRSSTAPPAADRKDAKGEQRQAGHHEHSLGRPAARQRDRHGRGAGIDAGWRGNQGALSRVEVRDTTAARGRAEHGRRSDPTYPA